MRPLVLALPSGSPVVPGLAAGLVDALRATGAEPVAFGPLADPVREIQAYRRSLPRRAGGRFWALRWVLAYPIVQGEMAIRVFQQRRRIDFLVCFLGCHFLLPMLAARFLGIPILYLPGGRAEDRAPGTRPLAFLARRLATIVGVEAEAECAGAFAAKTHSGALRGAPQAPDGAPPSERRTVLFLSRLEPHKGLPEFLQAVATLPPGYSAVVAGAGGLAAMAQEAAQQNPRIRFAGWVSDEERSRLLLDAALLVLPSKGGEGVPTVVVEAFHHGAPVLVADVGGVRDLVVDGETGWLLPASDAGSVSAAMGRALLDPELDAVSERARAVARTRLSASEASQRFAGLLGRLPAGRQPGPARFVATTATLANAVCATLALFMAATAGPKSAAIVPLFVAGMVLDGFDGRIARRFGSVRQGAVLDATADALTYVALPAFLAAQTAVGAAALFAFAGVLRLARFAGAPEAATYRGLPASVAGAFLVLVSQSAGPPLLTVAAALILAVLMLLPIRYPKLQGANRGWLAVLATLALAHGYVFAAVAPLRPVVLATGLAITSLVLVVAPFVALGPGAPRSDVRAAPQDVEVR